MERRDDEVHLDVDEARGAYEPHVTRYVLSISLLLVILAFILIWVLKFH